jgi:hypothetical protein
MSRVTIVRALILAIMGILIAASPKCYASRSKGDIFPAAAKKRLAQIGLEGIRFCGVGPFGPWCGYGPSDFSLFGGFELVVPRFGVTFSRVKPGSVAAKAGLKSGDIVILVDGQATWPSYLPGFKGGCLLLSDAEHISANFGTLIQQKGKNTWKRGTSTWRVLRPYEDPESITRTSYKQLTLTIPLP